MFSIRGVSEVDVELLVPLRASLHALHVSRRPDVFRAMSNDEIAAWLRERLADERTRAWMADDAGQAVGYLLALRRDREETRFSTGRQWCEIDEVAVDIDHQRRGVGRALLERALTHARDSGLEKVELSTWAFNEPAHEAFTHAGFRPMLVRYELSAPSLDA